MDRQASVIQNVSTLEYSSGVPGEENSKGSTNGSSEKVTVVKKKFSIWNIWHQSLSISEYIKYNETRVFFLWASSFDYLIISVQTASQKWFRILWWHTGPEPATENWSWTLWRMWQEPKPSAGIWGKFFVFTNFAANQSQWNCSRSACVRLPNAGSSFYVAVRVHRDWNVSEKKAVGFVSASSCIHFSGPCGGPAYFSRQTTRQLLFALPLTQLWTVQNEQGKLSQFCNRSQNGSID